MDGNNNDSGCVDAFDGGGGDRVSGDDGSSKE